MGPRKARRSNVKACANAGWRGAVRRAGLPLALFAIVLQVVISFGHHHFNRYGSTSSGGTIAVATGPQVAQPASPDGDGRRGAPVREVCQVCLAGHSAVPPVLDASGIPSRDGVRAVPLLRSPAPLLPVRRVAAFDSRGPPPG